MFVKWLETSSEIYTKQNDFKFSHPLGSVRKNEQNYDLFIGNQKISTLIPSYYPKKKCSDQITVLIDGKYEQMTFAKEFFVTADFKIVNHDSNTRVNIIGFTKKEAKDESNLRITLKDLDSKYAIDTFRKSYRIEFYRQNCFCGMVLVHFK